MFASIDRFYPFLWWNVSESQRIRTQWQPECHWHLWAALICECLSTDSTRQRKLSGLSKEEFVTRVIFKLDSISLCPPLRSFGPHMSFISICRNCETFTTMDCDRFHKLNFTVALGGKKQCSPSVDCDCTRHFHETQPFCNCLQFYDSYGIFYKKQKMWFVLEVEVKKSFFLTIGRQGK